MTLSQAENGPGLMAANRLQHLQASYLREILAVAGRRNMISFAGGLPAEACFPVSLIRQLSTDQTASELLQYGGSQGLDELLTVLRQRSPMPDNHDVLVTNGAQQGLDLILRAFVNPGDRIAIEAPCYLGALQAFQLAEAEVISVPALGGVSEEYEADRLAVLESLFAQQDIKFFYAIADFHNPTGASYSLKMRHEIVRLCEKYGVFLIEDAPYRELRFVGKSLPMLADLSPARTLLLRSFSKIACPGLRLGCVQADKKFIGQLLKVKQVTDLHTQLPGQALLAGLLSHREFADHLQQLRQEYLQRYMAMSESVQLHLPEWVTLRPVEGGMFIWLELDLSGSRLSGQIDELRVAEQAIEQGVTVVPGSVFYPQKQVSAAFRLNFSHESVANIDLGIRRFSRVLAMLER
ncbi:aminotransferase-like domain-containing protein [Aliamphritea ceti]|uniref:aminotransferase-like domain-containing protein n=1 Tax=Aliamphritea ceti TaxID=1524258 RepID=UPI0021C27CD9|nr:PLP-dependent aminotransferase family protein [Aliamphritea ceti]